MRRFNVVLVLSVVLAMVLAPLSSIAKVTQSGDWPADEASVTLELEDVSRADAVKKLAEAAGWSVVLHAPETDRVDLRVVDQPPSKVLALLLEDGNYEATRDGALISIRFAGSLPAPGAGAKDRVEAGSGDDDDDDDDNDNDNDNDKDDDDAASGDDDDADEPDTKALGAKGRDVVITGRSARIEADEVVRDVTVMGGSLDVFGRATGDVTVVGGRAHLHPGSYVEGDATAVGGSLTIDDGATVRGDAGVVGGALDRRANAVIGGDIDSIGDGDGHHAEHEESLGSRISSTITNTALLFVFGAVLLALGARRMERLTVEIAARPMRSFALGIVGFIGFIVAALALCVTLVGIPIAIVGVLLGILAVFAATCAALTTLGAALAAHRSQNVYVHLAVGCAIYLVAGVLPWVGGLIQAAIVLAGIGAIVATRGAGFFEKRGRGQGSPYRDPA